MVVWNPETHSKIRQKEQREEKNRRTLKADINLSSKSYQQ